MKEFTFRRYFKLETFHNKKGLCLLAGAKDNCLFA